jgi:hypothetical protein
VLITPTYDIKNITLKCSADGATHYQWTDLTTGELVSSNSTYYISTKHGKISGQYKCTALNKAGNNTAVIKGINSFTACG